MAGEQTEPSLQGIIESMMTGGFFGGDGWEGIENSGQAISKDRKEMRSQFAKEAQIIRDTFKTEPGQQCLEIFLNQSMRRSAWPVEMNCEENVLTSLGIFREGQNAFVAAIIEAYAAADEDDETQVEPRIQT